MFSSTFLTSQTRLGLKRRTRRKNSRSLVQMARCWQVLFCFVVFWTQMEIKSEDLLLSVEKEETESAAMDEKRPS